MQAPTKLQVAFAAAENEYQKAAQALHRKALELADVSEVYKKLKKRRDELRGRLERVLNKGRR